MPCSFCLHLKQRLETSSYYCPAFFLLIILSISVIILSVEEKISGDNGKKGFIGIE